MTPRDIKVTFDFRQDTPKGKDPDRYSKTLRLYHKLLWSKPLPGGDLLALDDMTRSSYLHYRSSAGEDFCLASDAVVPTFRWHPNIKRLISGEGLDEFNAIGYTIGGMMLFPGNRIGGKWTINQARGCTKRIADRFDLTLECIRRHYKGGASPLSGALARYGTFFDLFRDFTGYVKFFLLQDLVSADGTVLIAPPFDDFRESPIPATVDEYRAYKDASIAFIKARNQRIAASL